MDELVCGVFKAEAVSYFQRVFVRMKDAGCDAVVLGCTEIPLIMSDANSPLPTLDSARLLARAALRHAMAAEPALTFGLDRLSLDGHQNVPIMFLSDVTQQEPPRWKPENWSF